MSGVENDAAITDVAVEFAAEIMGAVNKDVVKPRDWWSRCRAALEAAASASETWAQFVSRFGQKMQIESIPSEIATDVALLEAHLIENKWWPRFRYLVQRDALYISAMAQVRRKERFGKKAKGE